MLTLAGEKMFQHLIGTNVDTVFQAIDVPAGCTLKNVHIKLSVIGSFLAREREQAWGYGIAAYFLPVEDPDTRVSYDTLWDRFVPKYTDVDIIDLDTTTGAATPFWEPGEASFEDVYDMGNQPLKTFGRKKLLNFGDVGSAGFRFQPSETPFEPQWFGADVVHIRMNRSMKTKGPMVWAVAFAAPAFDDTVTAFAQLGENQWGQIQYAEATLERSLIDQLVLVEAGAETPFEEASDTMRQYLAPNVFELTAGSFVTESCILFGTTSWELDVPGRLSLDRVDLTP